MAKTLLFCSLALLLSLVIVYGQEQQTLPLGLLSSVEVPEGFVEKIAKMEGETLQFVVDRLVKEKTMTLDQAKEARVNFLRWASLRLITTDSLAPSLQVDEFWHSFLMFTWKYQK